MILRQVLDCYQMSKDQLFERIRKGMNFLRESVLVLIYPPPGVVILATEIWPLINAVLSPIRMTYAAEGSNGVAVFVLI